jgi:hypothetical protein
MPQTWVFDGIVLRLAAELAAVDPPLAAVVRDAESKVRGFGHLDVTALPPSTFERLVSAATRTFTSAVAGGPSAFAEPGAYTRYMCQFSELRAMLCCDPRLHHAGSGGTIRLSSDSLWRGTPCVAAFVLEQLAIAVQSKRPQLAARLLASPTVGADLSDLDSEDRRALVPGLEWIRARYADGEGRDGYAPQFYASLGAEVRAFLDAALPWVTE